MGLDNVAVQWPRTGRFYDPVAPAEFVDFGGLAEHEPTAPGPAIALADRVAQTGTVRVTAFTELVDLVLGLKGVLYATDAAAEDEDPVIDPDGCAWIAGGLERFVAAHAELGDEVTFETATDVLRKAIAAGRLADQHCAGWTVGSKKCVTNVATYRPGASPAGTERAGAVLSPVR